MIKKIFFFLLSTSSLLATNALNNVTVSEYAGFLNLVAKEDPHTLYDQKMGEESGAAAIERVGEPGNYSYRCHEEEAEEPVMFVDLRSAMRFCNWKQNGELEDPTTTEYGVYELEGDQLIAVHIDEKTNYFLPEENDDIASEAHPCLKLGSLEEPDSWLRSNQVLFHMKGRLENMAATLSQEAPTSWWKDAEYVAGAVVGIAAVATCFKYRGECYPRREGYERIPDAALDGERRRKDTDSVTSNSAGSKRGFQLGAQENNAAATFAVPEEAKEKNFQTEAQTFINQQIFPRTQMIESALDLTNGSRDQIQLTEPFERKVAAVRAQGEKYIQFFKNNFEKIFQHQQRTLELQKLMEPYMQKLEKAAKNPTSPTIIARIASAVSDSLTAEHQKIMTAAKKYCTDFDASWTKACEATQQQHGFFTELQVKEHWINDFPRTVHEEAERVNDELKKGAIGEIVSHARNSEIKMFFDNTFGRESLADQVAMERLTQEAKAKFPRWHQQLEQLPFWNAAASVEVMQQAQAVAGLAHQETEVLLKACADWKNKTTEVIARAGQRYDAVNHIFPGLAENSSITTEQRALVIKAVNEVNLNHKISIPFYPVNNAAEQVYLQHWVGEQYNKIKKELHYQRSYLSLDTYTSPIKGTLPENEKEVLRYFLTVLDSSKFDFIRKKAAVLRAELDPDLGGSDDSDEGF